MSSHVGGCLHGQNHFSPIKPFTIMRKLKTILLASFLLWIAACTNPNQLDPVAENPQQTEEQLELARQIEAKAYERLEAQEARILNHPNYQNQSRAIVYLEAGSVDGLQAAISQAGPFGTVIVQSGLHIENQMVTVSQPVKIVGQNGAIIQSNVAPVLNQNANDPTTFPNQINPSLLVDGASFVVIRNLKFVPDPNTGFGELAIALQEADNSIVRANEFQNFGGSVAVNQSDNVVVRNNVGNGTLSDGAPIASNAGILIASGGSAMVAKNSMNDFLYGYFMSDKHGVALENTGNANFIGFVWCTWQPNITLLPTGDYIEAEFPASQWSGVRNLAENSLSNGLIVIDGANQNTLVSNNGINSGANDVEFFGIVNIPPFGNVPVSANNTFIAGAYPNVGVRDCGVNNTIIGGILDPTPCQ
jgi:hypothetical protein